VKLADSLQVLGLVAITIALFLNYKQARETGRQANEASKQVDLSTSIVNQEAYRQLTAYGANFNAMLFNASEDLLAWYLSSRNIPVGSHDANLRHLFIFVRMDVHEAVYLSHTSERLDKSAWSAWTKVIEADAATSEFRAVWQAVRHQYMSEFAAFVAILIEKQDATARSQLNEV
jgi:hypothetical protein